MEQQLGFCTAEDGVRICYATAGEGPPLVKAPNWLSHLEYDWRSPVRWHWWEELAWDWWRSVSGGYYVREKILKCPSG